MVKITSPFTAGILKVSKALIFASLLWKIASDNKTLAQIAPDHTLGAESSILTPNITIDGSLAHRIDGGAIRGGNIFHSFETFNIGNGGRVYFANPAGIANIFSRVTGKDTSDILGTLGVDGGANLFLMNPNGIIFGENSALDVRGSFVATTANGIQFENGGFFSTSNSEVSPLLTVKPSAFLFNQIVPGRIDNHSITTAGSNLLGESLQGLRVPDGENLLLIGGDITLAGGGLHALGGKVVLVGLSGAGTVGLNVNGNNFSLNFPQSLARGDISVTNKSIISTSGDGGGEIQVWGRNISLTEDSQIIAMNLGSKAGKGLIVDASESVELIGAGFRQFEQTFIVGGLSGQISPSNPGTGLFTGTVGGGAGGSIAINTKHLILRDGAIIFSPTFSQFSQGSGGNITIQASESVEGIASGLITSTLRGATGNAGDISIDTQRLILRDGAVITSVTLSEGSGGKIAINASESVEVLDTPIAAVAPTGIFANTIGGSGEAGGITIDTGKLIIRGGAQMATQSGFGFFGIPSGGLGGDLTIKASEFVEVSGISRDYRIGSGLFSGTESSSEGGNLTITTPTLLVQNLAIVTSRTLGTGKGGDLTINTDRLQVDRGQISTGTLGAGEGGILKVTAAEVVKLSDTFTNEELSNTLFAIREGSRISIIPTASDPVAIFNGLIASTEGSGNAGNIIIYTPLLIVQNGTIIAANSQGAGNAGRIEIDAGLVEMNNGFILAGTTSGNGGNIGLHIDDLLLMQSGSRISATAGTAKAGGDGGNITINAGVIVTIPNENNDITANAFSGKGGNVNITTQGLYNFTIRSREEIQSLLGSDDLSQFDPSQLPTNDITAISQIYPQLSQIPVLNLQGIDPASGLIELPLDIVDVARLVQNNLCEASHGSSFIVTGRGGLPPTPNQSLNVEATWEDWRIGVVNESIESKESHGLTLNNQSIIDNKAKEIIEAQGWYKDGNGNVILTANPTEVTPHSSWLSGANCRDRK